MITRWVGVIEKWSALRRRAITT